MRWDDIASISERTVEKNKSYKALGVVDAIIMKDSVYHVTGKLLLYFSKDSVSNTIVYGNRIIIKKELQEIKNSGNPAAFDYKRYCAFQQIFHQCYLKKSDWVLLKEKKVSTYHKIIFKTRDFIISVIDKYITENDES